MLELVSHKGMLRTFVLTTPAHDLCKVTHEPQQGSVIIVEYINTPTHILGLRAIQHYIDSVRETALDLETLVNQIRIEVARVFPNSKVSAYFILSNGITLTI